MSIFLCFMKDLGVEPLPEKLVEYFWISLSFARGHTLPDKEAKELLLS